jgi:hypothetical protein
LFQTIAALSRHSPAKAEGQAVIPQDIAVIPKLLEENSGIAHDRYQMFSQNSLKNCSDYPGACQDVMAGGGSL